MYSEDNDHFIREIKNITNTLFLHIISANYNWNSGLDVPQAILDNQYCDFGTGLLLFYNADGYRLLDSQDVVLDSPLKGWKEFLTNLYKKLLDTDFSTQGISFTRSLTKVQIFKLKKSNPSIPDILISKSPGNEEEIPTLKLLFCGGYPVPNGFFIQPVTH